jgi:hypothetical protein
MAHTLGQWLRIMASYGVHSSLTRLNQEGHRESNENGEEDQICRCMPSHTQEASVQWLNHLGKATGEDINFAPPSNPTLLYKTCQAQAVTSYRNAYLTP